MKTVVFGGSGFLGSAMVETLLHWNHKVTNIDVDDHPNKELNKHPLYDYICGDIMDDNKLIQWVQTTDVVFNYVAIADIKDCNKDPLQAVTLNFLANAYLLEACSRCPKLERFIYASSLYADSNLGGVYATTKKASELLIKNYNELYNLDYTILRYGTVYGPLANHQNSVYRYLHEAIWTGEIHYQGTGDEIREYINVDDAAYLSLMACNAEYKNSTVMLTGHRAIKTKDLFNMINEILGGKIKIKYNSQDRKDQLKSHYLYTPFSLNNEKVYKLVGNTYKDLGQGLLECSKLILEEKESRL